MRGTYKSTGERKQELDLNSNLHFWHRKGENRQSGSYKQTEQDQSSITDPSAGHLEVPQTTDELHHNDGFQVLLRESGRKNL